MIAPPRLARRLLWAALPETHRAVVLADLDEEFTERISPGRSRLSASQWYWRQVLRSLPGAVRMRVRFQSADLVRDLRYGARMLRRSPAFSATAILTLTIGIGATSAVLTLANAVLVRPLPYADPDRIVSVMEIDRLRDNSSGNLSWPDFIDYARDNQTLTAMAAYSGGSRTLTAPGAPAQRVAAVMVTGRFFEVLGVNAAAGRALADEDIPQGAPPVAMVTHASWRNRFGGDPQIVGRRVVLNDVPTTIVGVLPETFEFPPRGQAELWMPVHPSKNQMERKFFHWMDAIGRLKPGVTRAEAAADLDRVARSFAPLDPRAHQTSSAIAPLLRDRIVGNVRPTLLILSGASILVLLVACANIAGLLLAQSATRTSEMAVRSVMGAGRSRLFRQLLAENIALAVPGGLLGIAAGQWMVRGLVASMPPAQRLTLPHIASLSLDGQALAISLGLTIVASLVFGMIPAWRTARTDRLQSTRGVTGLGARELRLQSAFVVVQVALALLLLAGAGLMAQSLRRLLDVSPGFRTDHLLTMTVALPQRYREAPAISSFHRVLTDRMASLPGVLGASINDQLPLGGAGNSGSFTIVGDAGSKETVTLVRTVAENYFDVMGIRVEEGRRFAPTDSPSSPPVVLVNRIVVERAGVPLVGKRVVFPFMPGQEMEVVGIVGNEQYDALDRAAQPVLYFPQTQGPSTNFTLLLRTAGDPAAMVPSVVAAIAELDPSIPVYQRASMDDILSRSEAVFRRRSVLTLIGGFAASALLLAAVGLYGVLTQIVAQRTQEIGVRLALGAGRAKIAGDLLRRGLAPVAIGVAAGLAGSLALGRYLGGLLYGTSAEDPLTLSFVVAVLGATALVACIIPARRALRVNPVDALRG